MSIGKIPAFKPLAIIEQDELLQLKQKRAELEMKLKQKELQAQAPPKEEENLIPTLPITERTPKKIKQKDKQKNNEAANQQQAAQSLAQLKEAERQENEVKSLKATIEHLEKEKKILQKQFDQIRESIRADNMQLKETAIKCKAECTNYQRQKDDLENEKQNLVKELRKMRQDNRILQERCNELMKSASELDSKARSNKDIVLEREDRIQWAEARLLQEEHSHKATQGRLLHLQNDVQNLKREIEFHKKEREKAQQQIEEMASTHNRKNEEQSELRLKNQRDLNDAKLLQEEYKRQINQQAERIRTLELERERILVRLEDFEKIKTKLGAREREIIELEVELDRVKRAKGTHIIEKIVEPVMYTVPSRAQEVVQHPVEDREIVSLREDLLYLQQDRDRALDEADYWRKRYEDLELQDDRGINLLAHQNAQEYEINTELEQQKQEMFRKVLALVNDINLRKRQTQNAELRECLDQILNNNSDILKNLAR